MVKEVWRPVVGYEGYEVSNLGRVRSLDRIRNSCYNSVSYIKGQILKLQDTLGYKYVVLSKEGKGKKCKVHRLMCIAFIPNPNNYPCINHKDEIRDNNFIYINEDGSVNLEKSNLEWCSYKHNVNWGTGLERRIKAQLNHPDESIPVAQYTKQWVLVATYPSMAEAQRVTGIAVGSISKCVSQIPQYDKRRNKYYIRSTAGGYIWRYA